MLVTTKGSFDLAATREDVWAALHDIDRIASCVPGCRGATRREDGSHALGARVALGPVRIVFDGVIAIEDFEAPSRLTLTGQGQGGRAGAAGGTARIRLDERRGGCRLAFAIEAHADGPITRLGPAMLTWIAATLAALFARRFAGLFERGDHPSPWRPRSASSPKISRSL